MAELILDSPAWVLSDEVYRRIAYDGEVASTASVPGMLERTVLLDGLSKTYSMTGWRCGYAAVPEPLVDPLTRLDHQLGFVRSRVRSGCRRRCAHRPASSV